MIKIMAAGSLDYLRRGVEFLTSEGYKPLMVIENSNKNKDFIDNHIEEIKRKKVDLLVCLAYPKILNKKILDLFPKGCINLHAGLPDYRGRHPVNWMLIDGVREIPVSVHYMDEGIDTGNIIIQDDILVKRDDDYNSVLEKITNLEGKLLLAAIRQIEFGTVYERKQHKDLLRYTRKRTPDDSMLNWKDSSVKLHRFINALVDPMPNAFINMEKEKIEFKRSYIGENVGEVLDETIDGRYVISTSDGVILVRTNAKLNVGARLNK